MAGLLKLVEDWLVEKPERIVLNEQMPEELGEVLYAKRFSLAWVDEPPEGLLAWVRDVRQNGPGLRYREWCDGQFSGCIAPVVMSSFGDLGDTLCNTLNEAIMNYAEHAYLPVVREREIGVQVTLAGYGDGRRAAWGVVSVPEDARLVAPLNPARLQRKKLGEGTRPGKGSYRGWGTTILAGLMPHAVYTREPSGSYSLKIGTDGRDAMPASLARCS